MALEDVLERIATALEVLSGKAEADAKGVPTDEAASAKSGKKRGGCPKGSKNKEKEADWPLKNRKEKDPANPANPVDPEDPEDPEDPLGLDDDDDEPEIEIPSPLNKSAVRAALLAMATASDDSQKGRADSMILLKEHGAATMGNLNPKNYEAVFVKAVQYVRELENA